MHSFSQASKEKIEFRARVCPEHFLVVELDGEVIGFVNGTRVLRAHASPSIIRFGDGEAHASGDHGSAHTNAPERAAEHEDMFERAMASHDPQGDVLAIHSVSVLPEHRRKGFATAALTEYERRARDAKQAREIALLCKERLLELYKGAGYEYVGFSDCVHGKDRWIEMRKNLL